MSSQLQNLDAGMLVEIESDAIVLFEESGSARLDLEPERQDLRHTLVGTGCHSPAERYCGQIYFNQSRKQKHNSPIGKSSWAAPPISPNL